MQDIGRLGQLQQALKKWGDVRGLPQYHLATEVLPTLNLGDLDAPPYHSKQGATFGALEGASVGNLTLSGVALDATSTELWVLRSCFASVNAANTALRLMAGAGAGITGLTSRPFRSWDDPGSSPAFSGGSFGGNPAAAPAGADIGRFALQANGPVELVRGPIVIRPGSGVWVVTEAANLPLWVTWYLDRYQL